MASSTSSEEKPTLPKPKPSAENTEPTSTEQFIFDQVKEKYDFENTRSNALDSKANNLLGLIGIILSIVLAGNGILYTDYTKVDTQFRITQGEMQVLIAILIFLAISLGLGCGALWLVNYTRVPNARIFIKVLCKAK